jgi:hypothetical protein
MENHHAIQMHALHKRWWCLPVADGLFHANTAPAFPQPVGQTGK